MSRSVLFAATAFDLRNHCYSVHYYSSTSVYYSSSGISGGTGCRLALNLIDKGDRMLGGGGLYLVTYGRVPDIGRRISCTSSRSRSNVGGYFKETSQVCLRIELLRRPAFSSRSSAHTYIALSHAPDVPRSSYR